MSLIDGALTTVEKQNKTKILILNELQSGTVIIQSIGERIFDHVWNNADGLSAQEVFDSFGSNAATFATLFQQIVGLLNTIKPGVWTRTRPGTITANVGENGQPDGTVTVTLIQPQFEGSEGVQS